MLICWGLHSCTIERPEWTCRRGVCGCPYVGGIGYAKGRGGARKRVIGVGGANDVVSVVVSDEGGTGMLEGNANGGDRELEGTEHEVSILDILLNSVSFY